MKINKQSNLYTIIYVAVIVLIVGAALAITSLSLKAVSYTHLRAHET